MVPIVFAAEGSTVLDASAVSTIQSALSAQFNSTALTSVLSAGITAVIGICFVWWAARKLVKLFNSSFKRGKLRL